MKKRKVLFIRMLKSSFIQKDIELLENNFDVKVLNFNFNKKNSNGTLLTEFRLITGILWADITYSWFADFHAYQAVKLSKLFKKKSIVIIGGYEVANIPELGYGAMLSPIRSQRVEYVLKNADLILTVDESLKKDILEIPGINGNNIFTIPTGYDYNFFKPSGNKENLIITVSTGNNWERVRLKGLDTFIKSAQLLPDLKFIVIGIQGDALKRLSNIASTNVEFISPLTHNELILFYQKANIYCQLSIREGLPNALCEAMLCECIPVGTDVQGVQTAIGDTGFFVPYSNPEATAKAIKKALKSNKGKEARKRITTMFPIDKREKDLVKIIGSVLLPVR